MRGTRTKTARRKAIEAAKKIVGMDPVFLDTETTGLDQNAEIVEVAIVAADGQALVNTLVKPERPIPREATQIHGITNKDVADAPTFARVWQERLQPILARGPVVIFNAPFDLRMIKQSLRRYGLAPEGIKAATCLMKLYAEFREEWNAARGNYRWQTLENAARQCRLELPADLHRALGDAFLARAVLHHMASQAD